MLKLGNKEDWMFFQIKLIRSYPRTSQQAILSTTTLTLLEMVKKISICDPLQVLVMDMAGYVENYSKTVYMVSNNPAIISLVVMFNTDMDTNTSRRHHVAQLQADQKRQDRRGYVAAVP